MQKWVLYDPLDRRAGGLRPTDSESILDIERAGVR